MNKFGRILLPSLAAAFLLFIGLNSCKKINEATEIGTELIPTVDNVNTFELTLPTITNLDSLADTTLTGRDDLLALGTLTDPEFGNTDARIFFNILPPSRGVNPFTNKDSVLAIDSVVLSLQYAGYYGDTNATQTVRVYEIDQSADFQQDSILFYQFNRSQPFAKNPTLLGTKTFQVRNLDDSVTIIRKRDTIRQVNVLRIPINISFGQKLANFTSGLPTSYPSDETFYSLVKGLTVEANAGSDALTYYKLNDNTRTRLTVYFRLKKNGAIDTTSADFYHGRSGVGARASLVSRNPSGNYASYLNNGNPSDDKLYIQSTPGSYAGINIPGLDTMKNKVIHRAELIVKRIPSAGDRIYFAPNTLFLDKTTTGRIVDTAYSILDELNASLNTSTVNFNVFGGLLRPDSTYRFNLTKHVQDIIARKAINYRLRLYAPLRSRIFVYNNNNPNTRIFSVLPAIAYGRVVLAGGSYPDPAVKLRLRIIYSEIK